MARYAQPKQHANLARRQNNDQKDSRNLTKDTTMATRTWLYYASSSQADASRTFELAITENVIVRNVVNKRGALIANVGRLAPGDDLILAYRGQRYGLIATLAEPRNPNGRAPAIEMLQGEFAIDVAGNDYRVLDGDRLEVLLLEEVERFSLDDTIPNLGMGTLHDISGSSLEKRIRAAKIQSSDEVNEVSAKVVESSAEDFEESGHVVEATLGNRSNLFDSYIMIDWSSRNEPTRGADSIWVAHFSSELTMHTVNFSTRMECIAWLLETLREKEASKVSTLVGFDFAFSYPTGYFKLLAVNNWRKLIEYYANNVVDSVTNEHNRDDFARSINREFGVGPGPFWGVTSNSACDRLETRRVGRFTFPYDVDDISLTEFRHTEIAARLSGAIPQSVWKLNQGVAVGGQVVMGLGYLHQLLTTLNNIKAWPFETGWQHDKETLIHLAEIFPSLISTDDYRDQIISGAMCRDEAQVRSCCEYAAMLDQNGDLEQFFHAPQAFQDDAENGECVREQEGWILWSNIHEDR